MQNVAFAAGRRRVLIGKSWWSALALASMVVGARSAEAQSAAPVSAQAPAKSSGAASLSVGGEAKASAPSSAPTEDAKPVNEDEEWAERDRLLNESGTLTGATGLLRLEHAQAQAPGQFRLGFISEWFSDGFLCSAQFPCRNPNGAGRVVGGATTDHIGASVSLGVTLAKVGDGSIEGYLSTGGYANSNAANRPALLQVLGDSTLGFKYGAPVSKVFHLGGLAELLLVNGTGSVGLDGGGTSARFGPVATIDLRNLEKPSPIRFGANITYSLDNTANVIESTEKPVAQGGRGESVTRIERFGLRVNRVDHLDFRIGGEYFASPAVNLFAEYGILVPVNRQDYICKPTNPSGDKCLATNAIAPSSLTLGGRFFPWKKGFSLLAAFDIGVTGTTEFIEEVSPTPPWTLYLGAGWAIDTRDRPAKVVVKTERVESKASVRIRGFVHEAGKNEGIAKAIVSYENEPGLWGIVTGDDGHFATHELSDGNHKFSVTADGYKPGTCEATIKNGNPGVQTDCALEALPRTGIVSGVVKDADSGAPLPNVRVKLVDAQRREATVVSDSAGGYRFESIPPGNAEISAMADGYLAAVQSAEVKVRQDNHNDVAMRAKPKTALVVVTQREIVIKQQVQFAKDSSVILPESFGLMTEVADSLIRNSRIRRVEIQGHTDNTGAPDYNQRLSDQRAESVRTWLVQHGVESGRLTSKGYGQDRPLTPNVTAANRARNRRVQFIILEQDKPEPVTKPAPAAPAGPNLKDQFPQLKP